MYKKQFNENKVTLTSAKLNYSGLSYENFTARSLGMHPQFWKITSKSVDLF